MRPGPRSGFSALEFGLCLLVIGLVTGIIATGNHYARDRARMASCGSNLKQIAIAIAMYAADHGGCGPVAPMPAAIMPYTKNSQIFRCPANPDAPKVSLRPSSVSPGEDEASRMPLGYMFRTAVWNDDRPQTIVAQDIAPDLHCDDTWLGARLDGAIRSFPANQWRPLE